MPKHPMQPIVVDEHGVHRYKSNAIVRFLLDNGGFDLNKLTLINFEQEDWEQFAQLIGYSVSGACDLGYMSDRVCNKALRHSAKLAERTNSSGVAPELPRE